MTWLETPTETGWTCVLEVIWVTQERDALTLITELDLNHKQMMVIFPIQSS